MMSDMKKDPEIYQPGNFWMFYVNKIAEFYHEHHSVQTYYKHYCNTKLKRISYWDNEKNKLSSNI